MGNIINLPKNRKVELINVDVDENNNPFIRIKYKNEIYKIDKNDYFFFKYWFETIKE